MECENDHSSLSFFVVLYVYCFLQCFFSSGDESDLLPEALFLFVLVSLLS